MITSQSYVGAIFCMADIVAFCDPKQRSMQRASGATKKAGFASLAFIFGYFVCFQVALCGFFSFELL